MSGQLDLFDLVIFDCDGVLVDSEWLANQVETDSLNELGYAISLEEYLDIALGRPNDEVEQLLLDERGFRLPAGYWQAIRLRQQQVFLERLTPIPGVKEVIQALPVQCCVASGSDYERLKLTLTVTGLYSFLEGRIYGRECAKRGKPEPDIFLYAAERMEVAPARCLVIEDSIHGVHAAKAAGMAVWAFCGGQHLTEKRKQQVAEAGADYVFDDMRSVGLGFRKTKRRRDEEIGKRGSSK